MLIKCIRGCLLAFTHIFFTSYSTQILEVLVQDCCIDKLKLLIFEQNNWEIFLKLILTQRSQISSEKSCICVGYVEV